MEFCLETSSLQSCFPWLFVSESFHRNCVLQSTIILAMASASRTSAPSFDDLAFSFASDSTVNIGQVCAMCIINFCNHFADCTGGLCFFQMPIYCPSCEEEVVPERKSSKCPSCGRVLISKLFFFCILLVLSSQTPIFGHQLDVRPKQGLAVFLACPLALRTALICCRCLAALDQLDPNSSLSISSAEAAAALRKPLLLC